MNNIITCALPYANGDLHLGHFYEATCADIKSRYLKHKNIQHTFVSGDDCHGAATTLYCLKHNLDIPTHLQQQYHNHLAAYKQLHIDFDVFGQTNTQLHTQVVNWCVDNIIANSSAQNITLFETKDVLSWYDASSSQFLPDRYVKGVCPHCDTSGQSAEVCENCNKQIPASTLINPYNTLTLQSVSLKSTTHLVLNTSGFYSELEKHAHLLHPSIRNKLLDNSLQNTTHLDISRDDPYYGIEITQFPQLTKQFFYVWFDAPLAYITFSFAQWLGEKPATKQLFDTFCDSLVFEHFIGKDITYFHTFLWFNIIKYINPNIVVKQINSHGWLTLDSLKFSKSLGHSFDVSSLSEAQIDALRLYFFSKHYTSIIDTDFEQKQVAQYYNTTIVNGLANFYARSVKIAHNNEIVPSITVNDIAEKYDTLLNQCNYKKVFESINEDLAEINSNFQTLALWKESDKAVIENQINILLNQWYGIYLILQLVCPSLGALQTDILSGNFIHIAKRLEEFTIIKAN